MMAQFKGNQANLSQWLSTPQGSEYYDSLPDNAAVRSPRLVPAVMPKTTTFTQPRIMRGTINLSQVRPGFAAFVRKLPEGAKMVGNGLASFGGWLWKVITKAGGFILKAVKWIGQAAKTAYNVASELSSHYGEKMKRGVDKGVGYAKRFATNPYTRAKAAVNINRSMVASFKWVGDGIAKVLLKVGEGGGYALGKLAVGSIVTIGKTTFKVIELVGLGIGKAVGLTLKVMTKVNLGILKGVRGKSDLKLKPGQPVRNFFRKAKNKAVTAALSPTAKAMTMAEVGYTIPEVLKAFGVNTAELIETGKDRLQEIIGTEEEEE